jgi:hypothetical protein
MPMSSALYLIIRRKADLGLEVILCSIRWHAFLAKASKNVQTDGDLDKDFLSYIKRYGYFW